MRALTTRALLERFMAELGRLVRQPVHVYLTGGATAVWHGWRETTIDIDLKAIPDSDEVLRALVLLKERLHLNVELASPDQFIPELPGWRDRSRFIKSVGAVTFWHYDPYAQALSKIERGHAQDVADVHSALAQGLIEPEQLLELFEAIRPQLYRYPAIDEASFADAVQEVVRSAR
jgi:hypothetical protein